MKPATAPLLPTRILVVDDDRLVLATVAHGLSQAGFEVIDADNGDDAILLARQYRPALALLDIRMEGLSGFDVAAYLRDHLGTPFMFLSAFADEGTRAQVEALGAVDYLTKPLDVRQIVPAVRAALQRIGAGAVSGAAPGGGGAAAAIVNAPAGGSAGAGAGAGETPAAPPSASLVPAAPHPAPEPLGLPCSDEAWIGLALGLLMGHRHQDRERAWQQLQSAAQAARVDAATQARTVVESFERWLAVSAEPPRT